MRTRIGEDLFWSDDQSEIMLYDNYGTTELNLFTFLHKQKQLKYSCPVPKNPSKSGQVRLHPARMGVPPKGEYLPVILNLVI